MREAKVEMGSGKWEMGAMKWEVGNGKCDETESGSVGARQQIERLEGLREAAENVLQAAGYLVLTGGAVWLVFRFVP